MPIYPDEAHYLQCFSISSSDCPLVSGTSFQKNPVAIRQIAEKRKNAECMLNAATNGGNQRTLSALVDQLVNVAMDAARPRTRFGKISGVKTQITAQMDNAIQAI